MSSNPSATLSQTGRPDQTTLAGFCGIVAIGGLNFLLVKLSNTELPPIFGAGVRFGGAALVLFAVILVRRMQVPRGRALLGSLLYGILNFGVGYAFLYFALTRLRAGTTSVIMALVPLLTLIFAVLHRQERFSWRGVLGGCLALGGIVVLSVRELGGETPPLYLAAAFLGACAAAESGVLVKGFPRADPITTNAVGMGFAALVLLALSSGLDEAWTLPQSPRIWAVLVWLVLIGSIGLFGLVVFVIRRWRASATAYALTLMPVVAVTTGALFAGEAVTPEVVVGALLVLLGVYVGALSWRRPRAEPAIKGA